MDTLAVPPLSWEALQAMLSEGLGPDVVLEEVRELTGGVVHVALLLITTDGRRAVAKVSRTACDVDLAREALHLEALRQRGLPAPRVYAHLVGTADAPRSWLLMAFHEGVSLLEARQRCAPEAWDGLMAHLGELLATLHTVQGTDWGPVSGSAGPGGFASWPAFFRSLYSPAWDDVRGTSLLPPEANVRIAAVHARLDALLADAGPPCLTHGDPFGTNLLACPDADGRWRISAMLDPYLRWGSPEAELVRLEVAGIASPSLRETYARLRPESDARMRAHAPLYRLYNALEQLAFLVARRRQDVLAALDVLPPVESG
ncbi:aminoglycoside phosphotransferase family protein [Corallococcus aberystwythensis]|nr:aminoglycoside phosphotransferase family protein [Corallococcus aberystwythensis]